MPKTKTQAKREREAKQEMRALGIPIHEPREVEVTPYSEVAPPPVPKAERHESVQSPKEAGLTVDQERELVAMLWDEFKGAVASRQIWMERQIRWHKKRFGIRPKKTFPWPGCSNLHLPLIDKNIRKLKPSFIGALAVSPVAAFMDPNGETMGQEDYLEQEFHWLTSTRMDMYENYCISADMVLEKGFCVAKVFYDYQTSPARERLELDALPDEVKTALATSLDLTPVYEFLRRKGIPDVDQPENVDRLSSAWAKQSLSVELKWQGVEYDAPRCVIRSPETVIVPADTGDIEDARLVFDTYSLSGYQLKRGVAKGHFRRHVVEELLRRGAKATATGAPNPPPTTDQGETTEMQTAHQSKTGIDPFQVMGQTYKIAEAHVLVDVDQSGRDVRLVILMAEDYKDEPIAVYLSRRQRTCFRTIYFDKVNLEHFDHRGVAQMLDALQTAVTVQHNLEIDRQTIATALGFKYVPGKANPSQIRYIPGQGIAVDDLRNFEWITPPHMDGSFENQKASLKLWAEEYLGNPDFTLSQQGSRDTRTAAEINQISAEKQTVLSLDIKIFLNCWRRVFELIWEEWNDHGPREFVATMQGRTPVRVERTGMVRGKYQIVPNGSLWNSNPLLEYQKAQQRLAQFAGNPYIRQRPLYEDALAKDDPRLVKRLLASEEEVQSQMQQMALVQAQQQTAKKGQPTRVGA